jgi:hypothetical protein
MRAAALLANARASSRAETLRRKNKFESLAQTAIHQDSDLYLSLSTLLVEALPTLLTIALLMRYHGRSAGAARDTNALTLSDIGTSLLPTGAQSRVS